MKIHNRQSYLVSQSEGKARNRKTPKLTQLVYFLFLFLLFAYLIYFFVSRSIYIQDVGFVEIQKTNISSERGGKIIELSLNQNQEFVKDTPLATLAASKTCVTKTDGRINNLKFDIQEDRVVLDGMLGELALLKRIQSDNENQANNAVRRALEINASLTTNTFDNLNKQLELKNEIAVQRAKIANLMSKADLLGRQQYEVKIVDASCSNEVIRAPSDGRIFALKRREDEVVSRGEEILLMVSDDAEVFIEVFLDIELYGSISEQTTMKVTFPNGQETNAVISELNSSAYSTPDREWKDYQPVLPSLRVKLSPENDVDEALWKNFDRYQVEVRGTK